MPVFKFSLFLFNLLFNEILVLVMWYIFYFICLTCKCLIYYVCYIKISILDFLKSSNHMTIRPLFSILVNPQKDHSKLCRLREETRSGVCSCVCTHIYYFAHQQLPNIILIRYSSCCNSSKHQTHSPVIGTKVGQQSGLLGDQYQRHL